MTQGAQVAAESPFPDRRSCERSDPAWRAHLDAVHTLARAAELHDEDTGDHVLRIRLIVECIARRLDVPDPVCLGYDAVLHDVGKLMVGPDILKKPGELTEPERLAMQAHTIQGERLLSARETMKRAAVIARSHHERWDGGGYPDGIAGDMIPLPARITAAADVFDALVSDRCYKQGWKICEALREVKKLAGSSLDPAVVAALVDCVSAGELDGVFRPTAYVDESDDDNVGGDVA